jgi:hypothetical protein
MIPKKTVVRVMDISPNPIIPTLSGQALPARRSALNFVTAIQGRHMPC